MTNLGKSVRLFLLDAVPEGRWMLELLNWTGRAYRLPRPHIKSCSDRPELSGGGIYLLFGKSDETEHDLAYIDGSENVAASLEEQLTDKKFWTEGVVFISREDELTRPHIRYLAGRLYAAAKKMNRYALVNESPPPQAPVSEAGRADMEEFMENARLLLGVLGHRLLEPVAPPAKRGGRSELFFLRSPRGADARGQPAAGGFAVLRGSRIAPAPTPFLSRPFAELREKLLRSNVIDGSFAFTRDKVFASPSAAAAVVIGRNANGQTEWKTQDGKTLKDVELNQ